VYTSPNFRQQNNIYVVIQWYATFFGLLSVVWCLKYVLRARTFKSDENVIYAIISINKSCEQLDKAFFMVEICRSNLRIAIFIFILVHNNILIPIPVNFLKIKFSFFYHEISQISQFVFQWQPLSHMTCTNCTLHDTRHSGAVWMTQFTAQFWGFGSGPHEIKSQCRGLPEWVSKLWSVFSPIPRQLVPSLIPFQNYTIFIPTPTDSRIKMGNWNFHSRRRPLLRSLRKMSSLLACFIVLVYY